MYLEGNGRKEGGNRVQNHNIPALEEMKKNLSVRLRLLTAKKM